MEIRNITQKCCMDTSGIHVNPVQGSVLIFLLLIMGVIASITTHMLMQSMLIYKMSHQFRLQVQTFQKAEIALALEEKRRHAVERLAVEEYEAFVPDHLEFGCHEGFLVIQITVPPIQSRIAMRAP